MKICTNCGAFLSVKNDICPMCGSNIVRSQTFKPSYDKSKYHKKEIKIQK